MNWKADALQHAKQEDPRESCGLVVIVKGCELYWPCTNISEDEQQFVLDPSDFAAAEDAGEVIAVVHSHPIHAARPSQADLVSIERSGLPWYIVNPRLEQWSDAINPTGYKAPLIGRSWVWGITDCWTLTRDWYAEKGLDLPDWDRPATPELFEEKPMFDGCWRDAGFTELQQEDSLRVGDALLFSIGRSRFNHCGVYIGDQMVLHHLRNRLSSRDMYGGWLMKCTERRLRHPYTIKLGQG